MEPAAPVYPMGEATTDMQCSASVCGRQEDDSSIAIDAGIGEVDGAALVDPEQTQRS